MTVKADNVFHVIAEQVAKIEEPSEFYLLASPLGLHFAMVRPNHEITRVVDVAQSMYTDGLTLLTAHYNTAELADGSDPTFRDGCRGAVIVDNAVVEIMAREIAPQVHRVLFYRLSAATMYTSLVERVEALELVNGLATTSES